MTVKKIFYEILCVTVCVTIVVYMWQSVVFSKEILIGIKESILNIVNVVFPSLFGFMVVCEFTINSGLHRKISIIFKPISKYIFKMPPELFTVFMLSLIGGYPVGVKLLKNLVNSGEISQSTAEKMSCFCYCPSISFVIGIAGIGAFSSIKIGVIIYLCCVISNLIAGAYISRKNKFSVSKRVSPKTVLSAEKLTEAISSSGKSMLAISFTIIFFSYVKILLDCLKFYDIIKLKDGALLLKAVIEISELVKISGNYSLFPVITTVISFGGLCIIVQVIAINKRAFGLKKFFCARIYISALSGVISAIAFKLIPVDVPASEQVLVQRTSQDFDIFSLVCLFFMLIIIFFQKKNCNLKKSML